MKLGKTAFLVGFLVVLAACGVSPEAVLPQTTPAQTVTSLNTCGGGLPGSLDSCFGVGGKVISSWSAADDYLNSIALQPDGHILAPVTNYISSSGQYEMGVVRYNPDGSLDTTFQAQGITSAFNLSTFSVAVQNDGQIVLAGNGYRYVQLLRLNADGSRDTSFGDNGRVTTYCTYTGNNECSWLVARAVALQSDGKIVVAGHVTRSSGSDFLVIRYNPDGSLDTTFDRDGMAFTSLQPGEDQAYSVVIQSDDKIVAGGHSYISGNANLTSNNTFDFALVRYNPDGSLDTAFDGDGKRTVGFGSRNDGANSIALQPDGKIVAAGYAYSSNFSTHTDFALIRLNLDGALDTSFGVRGKLTTAIGNSTDVANSIAIQSDGKIVVGGSTYTSGNPALIGNNTNDFALVRYSPNGSLDTSFDGDGKRTTHFGETGIQRNDFGQSLVIQPDGMIVLAGTSQGNTHDLALARYNP